MNIYKNKYILCASVMKFLHGINDFGRKNTVLCCVRSQNNQNI